MERPSPDLELQCKSMCNAIVRAIQNRSFHVEFFSRSMTQVPKTQTKSRTRVSERSFFLYYMVACDHRSNEIPRS